jgi:hypothetical protein
MNDFSDGSPLHCLAWAASRLKHGGSMTLDYLEFLDKPCCVSLKPDFLDSRWKVLPPVSHYRPGTGPSDKLIISVERAKMRDFDVLKRQPNWRVVMRTVVAHSDPKTAAKTGLFGLLGDAPVQIVDWSDSPRIKAYFDFAEKCEQDKSVTISQDFRRELHYSMTGKLRDVIMKQFNSEELAAAMNPAIMFRLCTRMCNHHGYAHRQSGSRWNREGPTA